MTQTPPQIPIALTIAGSDSGGGAGLQADLKTFAFHQVHGACAVTCITAQNTLGVERVDALPPEAVQAQLEAVRSDMSVQSLKTGMLLNAGIVETVANWIEGAGIKSTVIDPVMVSRTGAVLLEPDAIAQIKASLVPKAMILTPNRYEAELLSGMTLQSESDIEQAARRILDLGAASVLIKGGGLTEQLHGVDFWFDGSRFEPLRTELVDTPHTHGTGCTLAAAIAANLALSNEPFTAVKRSKDYVTRALKYSLAIGKGQGPVGHWHPLISASV
ncbi:MAG: bifunctional hydroxymethylpyrimidine kinase/phosphomethylpyrimidine kinase [Cyanobacteria bacterium P01_F01_bin.42]